MGCCTTCIVDHVSLCLQSAYEEMLDIEGGQSSVQSLDLCQMQVCICYALSGLCSAHRAEQAYNRIIEESCACSKVLEPLIRCRSCNTPSLHLQVIIRANALTCYKIEACPMLLTMADITKMQCACASAVIASLAGCKKLRSCV